MKVLGIVLIVLGIFMIFFRDVIFTKETKVVDIGPIEINKKEKKHLTWPVYMGGVAVIAGAIVIAAATKKK